MTSPKARTTFNQSTGNDRERLSQSILETKTKETKVKLNRSRAIGVYGLETIVSVLFSNTRTRLLYNELEIFQVFMRYCNNALCNFDVAR